MDNTFQCWWFRILTHLANEDAKNKKFRSNFKRISYIDERMELWELSIAQQLHLDAPLY